MAEAEDVRTKPKRESISAKSAWTIGTYAASSGIRFATNIILSRLLSPEVLGIVVVAQAVRAGAELLTDVGMEQNVVHSPDGDDPDFLNTVWTMQIVRGTLIALACAALAYPLAGFYRIDVAVLLAMSAAPFLNSLLSTSLFTLSKRLAVRTRGLFELGIDAAGLVVTAGLSLLLQTVWGPILGILAAIAMRAAGSYWLPHPRHRLLLDRRHARAILHFGKWIMLTSLALYGAIYIDRLFLGRVAGLSVLGVYGLARAISDLPQMLAGRMAYQIVFPAMADDRDAQDSGARRELSRARLFFLLLGAGGIATAMAWSDWAIHILYGSRYAQAGWMLLLLLIGSWIGVLAALSEAAVFGRGRPQGVSVANLGRVVLMVVMLPAGFALGGLPGAILALPASEAVRYGTLLIVQRRLGVGFVAQDGAATLGLVALLAGWLLLRSALGLGVPWTMTG